MGANQSPDLVRDRGFCHVGPPPGLFMVNTGDGWTRASRDMAETERRARLGWEVAQQRIAAGGYDLLVLDEFAYPLHCGWRALRLSASWHATANRRSIWC